MGLSGADEFAYPLRMMMPLSRATALRPLSVAGFLALAGFAFGCSSSSDNPEANGNLPTNQDGDAPLSNLDDLMNGAPGKGDLPEEGKADAVYPPQYLELMGKQSPVKSQGRRGVCSIFATAAYMEHLYITEGTIPNPDFSEQFLQWSVKNEVKAYTNTEGSNAARNLEAIYRFGIVEEAAWPYESSKWTTANDSRCDGSESQPTICYTNGDPPTSAMSAQRWRLPRGRWLSSSARSIKAYMTTNKVGVVVGGPFYYQAWNHGASTLPTNQDYWRKGYVTYPNARDKEESEKHRAGHAILLVGWDDDLEVQKRDGDGKLLTDAEGKPVMEKGFFLFKNSWGTGSFGVSNPNGAGYGWISMKYVEEFLTAYGSGLPEVKPPPEVCNDGADNDRDGKADCDDADCANDGACTGSTGSYASTTQVPIPDNDPNGASSSIVVNEGGTIGAISVTVDITHSYSGDLVVKLVREGGGEVVLQSKQGGGEDDIKKTFSVTGFNGQDAAGTWKLVVIDTAKADTGTLNGWQLAITRCTGNQCVSSAKTYESNQSAAIPDGDVTGVFTNISVPDSGAIKAMRVDVDITHPSSMDLSIKLQRVGVPGEAVLVAPASLDGAFGKRTFTVSDFVGQDMSGTWRLVVADTASGDTGTLNGWALVVTR